MSRVREPSLQLLLTGETTGDDREAIRTLTRRRDYLVGLLGSGEDGRGGAYDRAEVSALNWALGLVRGLQLMATERRNMTDPDFRDVERRHDDLLADEAAEALRPDGDDDDESALGEHLAESRAVEDHQERKHETRD
jgi:hypothetical protein